MNRSEVEVKHPVQPDRVIARLLQFVVVANAEVICDVEQVTLVFRSEEGLDFGSQVFEYVG
jgi:hypothetical protein